jgi:hypothetical protein
MYTFTAAILYRVYSPYTSVFSKSRSFTYSIYGKCGTVGKQRFYNLDYLSSITPIKIMDTSCLRKKKVENSIKKDVIESEA